jgi:uncharacterized protein YigE (DUF2233 family)
MKKFTCLIVLLFFALISTLKAQGSWQLQAEHTSLVQGADLRLVTKVITGEREIRLYVIWPDPEQTRLIVLDNADSAHRLNQIMEQRHCFAGVNGGYFQPDNTPLGLTIGEGRKIQDFHRSKLLSGVVMVQGNRVTLLRRAEFSPAMNPAQALQAGPFLIDQGKPVAGLHNKKRARRTLMLANQTGRYGLAVAQTPVTLAELAQVLATPGIVHEIFLQRALNLDGGSSSALWARTLEGNFYMPEFKRVRNFLCVQGIN